MKKIHTFISLLLVTLAVFSPVTPVFTVPTAYAATDIVNDGTLSTGLLACYEMDETGGTRADSTINSYDLTDNNTVLSASGIIDNAADFEEANSERLTSTDSGLQTTGDMSMSFWMYIESMDTSRNVVWATFTSTGGNGGSFFTVENQATDYPRFGIYRTAGTDGEVTWNGEVSFSTATWYHVAWSYDASAGSIDLWVDGVQKTQKTGLPTGQEVRPTTYFGIDGNLGSTNFHDGLLDIVAVWNRTIDSTDVSNLRASGSGIPCVSAAAPRRIINI